MNCHHWTSFQESQVKCIALSLILFPQSRGFQFYFPHLVFPMKKNFFFPLVHVTWLSSSKFLVCAYLDAFTDIILHCMNVRRNWKVFSFCVKQAAINFFTRACVCVCARMCMCLCMYMHIDAHVIMSVHTCMACWFVHVCNFCTSTYS
jgi:hypothetical protein